MSDSSTTTTVSADLNTAATDLKDVASVADAAANSATDTAAVINEADSAVTDAVTKVETITTDATTDVKNVVVDAEANAAALVKNVETVVLPSAASAIIPPVETSTVTTITAAPTVDVPVPQTPKEIADSRSLSIVSEMVNEYVKIRSASVQTAKSLEAGAAYLSGILIRAVETQTPDVLNKVWEFFKEHAETGILDERNALSGVESLTASVRQRVEAVYTLFRKATTKNINVADPKLVNQNIVKTVVKSPGLISYLESKVKSIF